ncbi:MAG: polyprenol monophosphomannose synthase [Chloroflexota bacterium]
MTNPASAAPEPLVSVVIPTYNEAENIAMLAPRVLAALGETHAEVLVVDDASPDGTAGVVEALEAVDPRVRLVRRELKSGLSGAVFAGATQARGRYVAVMDADLSHDPEELPSMLACAQEGFDVVVGSRYVPGSAFLHQPLTRRVISRVMNQGARMLLGLRTRDVLTGYALCTREALAGMPTHHSAGGFKWLVELLATRRGLRVCEWPIVFQERQAGLSKATAREALTFTLLCLRLVPWRLRARRAR